MPKQMKNLAQNKAIFGLGARLKCSHDDLRELAFDVTGGRTDSIKDLTFDEANGMIRRLGGRAFNPPNQFNSRRTENYHKQKAGIKTIVTAEHLQKLNDVWFAKPHRTAEGLEAMCLRTIKVCPPRTAQECSKVIEGIKAMNSRERRFGAFEKKEVA